MTQGLILSALPDDRHVRVMVNAVGRRMLTYPGFMVFDPAQQRALEKISQEFWYPGENAPVDTRNLRWLINRCTEPDQHGEALKAFCKTVAATNLPCFNKPDAVLRTRRDLSAQVLEGVPHLTVPQTIRVRANRPGVFEDAFAKHGFDYPVLLRPHGSQTGLHQIKIDGPGDWGRTYSVPLYGRFTYMTQWVSFKNANGFWPKMRVVITRKTFGIRHVLPASGWSVHAMDRTEETAELEYQMLTRLKTSKALTALVDEARDRIDLDYFGMDLGCKSDTEFVLFEANAAMSILKVTHEPPVRLREYEENYRGLVEQVTSALSDFTGTDLRAV